MRQTRIQPILGVKTNPKTKFAKKKHESALERLNMPGNKMLQTRAQRRRSQYKQKASAGLNYLWIVFFVKKFVDILKSKRIESKLKKMDTYHMEIFDDAVFFKDAISNNKAFLNNPVYNFSVIF